MGVVLPSDAVAGQPKCGFATVEEGKTPVGLFQTLNPEREERLRVRGVARRVPGGGSTQSRDR